MAPNSAAPGDCWPSAPFLATAKDDMPRPLLRATKTRQGRERPRTVQPVFVSRSYTVEVAGLRWG